MTPKVNIPRQNRVVYRTIHFIITIAIAIVAGWHLDNYSRAFILLAGLHLGLAVFWDLKEMRIPNRLNLAFAITMLVACFALSILPESLRDPESSPNFNPSDFNGALLAGLATFFIFWILHSIHPQGLGLGDVKMAFGLGMFLGWFSLDALIWGFVMAFTLAGFVALVSLVSSAMKNRKETLPFAPMLGSGSLAGLTLALNLS